MRSRHPDTDQHDQHHDHNPNYGNRPPQLDVTVIDLTLLRTCLWIVFVDLIHVFLRLGTRQSTIKLL